MYYYYVGRVVLLTWGELPYESGASCLGASLMWGELSWGRVVLFLIEQNIGFQVPGEVGFFTSVGMTAGNYDDVELQKLKDLNTDVCFVCLGGSDIRPTSDPCKLVDKILIVTDKMKKSGVKTIFFIRNSDTWRFQEGSQS